MFVSTFLDSIYVLKQILPAASGRNILINSVLVSYLMCIIYKELSIFACLKNKRKWSKQCSAHATQRMCVCAVIKCLGSGVNFKHFKAGAFL